MELMNGLQTLTNSTIGLFVLLPIGISLLIYGADKLVDDTAEIAQRLGTSEFIIGLTVIAFGTSIPEFFVGIQSINYGAENVAMGTIIGSNIANIGLIFGFAAIGKSIYKRNPFMKKISNQKAFLVRKRQYLALLLSTFFLGISLMDLEIKPYEGALILSLLAGFMTAIWFDKGIDVSVLEDTDINDERSAPRIVMSLIFAFILLFLGSQLTLDSATGLASNFGISQAIIGLIVVAVGTSLPELAATISAIKKNKLSLIVGNVIGSNVFNIILVVPVLAFFGKARMDPNLFKEDFVVMSMMTVLFAAFLWLYSLRDSFNKTTQFIINISSYSFIFFYFLYIIFRVFF
tara:strand:+ start:903 stop:1943 length:1041 start_codon:yes stop_codon:yes gene_type:complete